MSNQQSQNPEAQESPPQKDLNISEIDLSQIATSDLWELKDKIDFLLSKDSQRIGDNDIVLEYSVRLRTKEGVVSNNEGVHRLNAILHPRLLSDAPGRFETEFIQNVFAPINADAYDLFDSASDSDNPLSSIKSHTKQLGNGTSNIQMPNFFSAGNLPGE